MTYVRGSKNDTNLTRNDIPRIGRVIELPSTYKPQT